LYAALIRPNGVVVILVLAITIARYIYEFSLSKRIKVGLVFGVFLLLHAFYYQAILASSIRDENIYQNTLKGVVIWGYPQSNLIMPQYDGVMISNIDFIKYIIEYPYSFIKLYITRIITELVAVRDFYSIAHNTFSYIYNIMILGFGFYGILISNKSSLKYILLIVITSHVVIIGFTFADWDGRFVLHFTSLILVFTGAGISDLTIKFSANSPKKNINY
jgi:hypothetical protein